MRDTNCDLLIVGGGPAALSAAVSASSEGLRTVVVEAGRLGGQAEASKAIENFIGLEKVTGRQLADVAIRQGYKFGVEFVTPLRVVSLARSGGLITVTSDDNQTRTCKTVILATGVSYQTLGAKNAGMYVNRGLEYVAIPKPGKGTHVIVGGGNSAGQAAVFLGSQCGCDVTMVVRGASLATSMSKYLIDRIEACSNINVMTNTEVVEVMGKSRMEKVVLESEGDQQIIPAKSMNVFIGTQPKTYWLRNIVALDKKGFVLTGADSKPFGWSLGREPFPYETNMPGIFAAGDVRAGSIKRISAAAGEGSSAVANIHNYLSLNGL